MPPLRDPEVRAKIVHLLSAPEEDDVVDWSATARRHLQELFSGRLTQRRVNACIRAWARDPSKDINVVEEVMEEYRHLGNRYEIRFGIGPPSTRVYLYFYLTAEFGREILRVAQFKFDRDYK